MSNSFPQLLKGFRDFGPSQMTARLDMFAKIQKAFERFGFSPMDTPVLEYAETLAGKYGADEKLMYRFRDHGDREVAMRYDLTVPMVRYYLANRNDLPNPFKRYQIGPAWRADNPQKGRYREFYQCDVDVIGSDSSLADADSIAAVAQAFSDLGVADVAVRINNRKILDGLFSIVGITLAQAGMVMRLIDKLDKVDEKKIRSELEVTGLTKAQVKQLFEFLNADPKDFENKLRSMLLQSSSLADGVGELNAVTKSLERLGVSGVQADLKLVRGADYYTGTVAEFILAKLPGIGSIGGGGRYDKLIGDMSGGKNAVPAVGMSIGIDRLIAALEELKLITYDLRADAIVFNLDNSLTEVYQDVARELRATGIGCDLYYAPSDMDKQFKYAEKKKIRIGIFIGDEEIKKGSVTLKDLTTRAQWKVRAEKLAQELEKALGK